jgi:ferredoxin--NADP+ reductase
VAARAELVPGRLFQLDLNAPRVAAAARPGHFVIIQATARSARVSLPIAGLDPGAGRLSVVYDSESWGAASLSALAPGAEPAALLGPIGQPSRLEPAASVLLVGEGAAAFGLVPVAQAMKAQGSRVSCLLSGEPACSALLAARLGCEGARLVDAGGGLAFEKVLGAQVEAERPGLVLAAGPLALLRTVQRVSAQMGVAARVRLNPVMLDGLGLCGGCRVKAGGRLSLCCLEGVEFEAPAVDFDYLERRERACRAQ